MKKYSFINLQAPFLMQKLLVNGLSFFRLPLTLAFDYALLFDDIRLLVCIVLFLIIALTDILDGKLARHYKIESQLGAILDVLTDFIFILSANLILYVRGLVPIIIIILILFKFIDFCFTSHYLNTSNNNLFFYDPIGRVVAVLLYVMPVIATIFYQILDINIFNLFMVVLASITLSLGFLSLIIRVYKIIKTKKN